MEWVETPYSFLAECVTEIKGWKCTDRPEEYFLKTRLLSLDKLKMYILQNGLLIDTVKIRYITPSFGPRDDKMVLRV